MTYPAELKELRVKEDVGEILTSAEDRTCTIIITVSGNSGSGVYNNNYEKHTYILYLTWKYA